MAKKIARKKKLASPVMNMLKCENVIKLVDDKTGEEKEQVCGCEVWYGNLVSFELISALDKSNPTGQDQIIPKPLIQCAKCGGVRKV